MGFFDTLLGNDAKDAANQAAADTYAKQIAAANEYKKYGETLPGAYANLAEAYSPYTQAGSSALAQLMAGLGLGGGPEGQQAFTNAYQNLPGYKEALATGTTAAQRALNAGHIGESGAALKALYRYGSDYENQRSGDYLNRLAGLAGSGLTATGQSVNTQGQGLLGQQNVRSGVYQGMNNAAPTIGQGIVAGAQAQQQGVQNLVNLAANLAGKAMGGGFMGGVGGSGGGGFGNFFSPSGYGGGFPVFPA